MSLVAIGLFVLACGWNVYRLFLPTRAAALRNEGHPQYFGAALAAGYIALLAIFLHAASGKLDWYSPALDKLVELAPQADKEPKEKDEKKDRKAEVVLPSILIGSLVVDGQSKVVDPAQAISAQSPAPSAKADPYKTVLAVGLWAALMALVLPSVLNAPFRHNSRLRLLVGRKSFNDVEEVLVDALDRGTSVAITLTTGKVYIGIPNEFDPNGDEADWVSVWPLASGYRTRKGNLRLTTAYEDAYNRIIGDGGFDLVPDDFKITLPLNHIVSIQTFKLQFYIEHFSRHASEGEDELSEALDQEEAHAGEEEMGPVELDFANPVGDRFLKVLKWTFHLTFTAAVVALPYSLWATGLFSVLAVFILVVLKDPEHELAQVLEAAREA